MKETYTKELEIRWADLDPNFHVVHSRYYDFGAFCRMSFLTENGIDAKWMLANNIGPVLFREEALFKREIIFGDKLKVNLKMLKMTRDMGRWSMRHELYTNGDTLAAIINLDGAWLNTIKRKLAAPPESLQHLFENAPRSKEFVWID